MNIRRVEIICEDGTVMVANRDAITYSVDDYEGSVSSPGWARIGIKINGTFQFHLATLKDVQRFDRDVSGIIKEIKAVIK